MKSLVLTTALVLTLEVLGLLFVCAVARWTLGWWERRRSRTVAAVAVRESQLPHAP